MKSLWMKSVWVKSMCKQSFLGEESVGEKYMGEKSIWVQSICKRSFWMKSLWVKNIGEHRVIDRENSWLSFRQPLVWFCRVIFHAAKLVEGGYQFTLGPVFRVQLMSR